MFSLYVSSLSIFLGISFLLFPVANANIGHADSITSFLVGQFIQGGLTLWTVSIGISLIGIAIVVIYKEMKK